MTTVTSIIPYLETDPEGNALRKILIGGHFLNYFFIMSFILMLSVF